MPELINYPAIIVANLLGLAILFSIAVCQRWRLRMPTKGNRCLILIFIIVAVACIVDPICFLLQKVEGRSHTAIIKLGISYLYVANLSVIYLWHSLVCAQLDIKPRPIHRILKRLLVVVYGLAILVNLFHPIIFDVQDGIYQRTEHFGWFLAFQAVTTLDSLFLSLSVEKKSGATKFFPVSAIIVPAAIGTILQASIYGISTLFPFYAVSLSCVTANMQNDFIFRDKLTGLYNRFYLDTLSRKLSKSGQQKYTAMMLDINRFKSINDTYGHAAGDQALIDFANVLRGVVNDRGTVIRYAGDEFIVILNWQDEAHTQTIIRKIREKLEEINQSGTRPYRLTIAVGHCELMFQSGTMQDFLDRIDRLMYENKKLFYQAHPEFERRK